MLKFSRIVGLACFTLLSLLVACGQKGSLTMPTEPAARNRATLPQVLNPSPAASSPTSSASAPKR